MLTAEGCLQRRRRFWERLGPWAEGDHVRLADPLHLTYLANFNVDPISLNAGFGGVLLLRQDGHAKLLYDDRLKSSAASAHVEETSVVHWYDGQTPGKGPRQLALLAAVNPSASGLRVHDRLGDPAASAVVGTLAQMRRQKDPDEIALLRECMKATDAGHAWARENVRPGMTEIDVYTGIVAACTRAAGRAVIVYGDFAVSPGPEKRGGAATSRVIRPGDMLILDYSVVIDNYRSDFTNTLAVGGAPTPQQQVLYDLATAAMAAGEKTLRAGAACQTVFDAVDGVFEKAGHTLPHHAGHGIGLTHPEAPFLVRHSTETLLENDVITLEPGIYVEGVGGLRIENNYRVTATGYEKLSNHMISLR
jgi:Xaa-Pro dipeptidase